MTHPERTDQYLETIFLLIRRNNAPARTTQIAAEMGVSPPSVTEMIQRLSETGLVHYKPYYGVELTESGEFQAKKMRHSNRVLRRFLTTVLGIEPETARREADVLQHNTSDIVLEHICQYMRYREFCPACEHSTGSRCCKFSQ